MITVSCKAEKEKPEEPEIKWPTFTELGKHSLKHSLRKPGNSRKTSTCFTDYTKAFDYVDHNKLRKALKEMGILDHLTCLLRNLCACPKQQLEACMEQLIGSRLTKGKDQAVCCHPVCLIYMLSTS